MKISTKILENLIDIPSNIIDVTNKHIIEVDDYYQTIDTTSLVVGHVLECEDHPDSDHLHVTKVDVGQELLQIVCGASNVKKGQYVVVAKVGTILPGNFQIKAAKIRGVESNGMICSLSELGIANNLLNEFEKDGIYVFGEKQEVGTDALKALALDGKTIELGLTPNRSDLLSVLGYARDLSAVTHLPLRLPKLNLIEDSLLNAYNVRILSNKGHRYALRHIEGVVIKDSPWWLKSSLIASGVTPINNVVDITNYILMLYGQPLHAFDASKISGKTLYVDHVQEEKVVALDKKEYVLDSNDVVIKDDKSVVAIAGVMGLLNSSIDESTTSVLLEAAIFEAESIKKTSERLNLKSDSSLRFERGIDENQTLNALNHAAYLIQEIAGGKILKGIKEEIKHPQVLKQIEIDINDFNIKLGTELSNKDIISYLERLGFIVKQTKTLLHVSVPSYRFDIHIKADLIEEVGRLYGLDDIANQELFHKSLGKLSHKQKQVRSIRHLIASLGFHETINYSLIDEKTLHQFKSSKSYTQLSKPLSMERSVLRQNLVSSLFETLKYNYARQNKNLALFEIGKVFNDEETLKLGFMMSGIFEKNDLDKHELSASFFTLKGILEILFDFLNIKVSYVKDESMGFHPYRYANILFQDTIIGYIGQVHPKLTKPEKLDDTFVAELDLDQILGKQNHFNYEPVSKFPTITRDLALVVKQDIPANTIISLIEQTLKKVLVSVDIFDVYTGSHIESGFKSIALRLTLNDREKTLETKDIDALVNRVVKRLEFEIKAQIRST